jgi:hypothetical protein
MLIGNYAGMILNVLKVAKWIQTPLRSRAVFACCIYEHNWSWTKW